MLEVEIRDFINYCKVSDFSGKSIETFTSRLREFVGNYKDPSIHTRKSRIWSLRQFFHFLRLNGLVDENIAVDLPYPKIEKRVPEFLTIQEYNSLLNHFHNKATDLTGLRNLVIIMILAKGDDRRYSNNLFL